MPVSRVYKCMLPGVIPNEVQVDVYLACANHRVGKALDPDLDGLASCSVYQRAAFGVQAGFFKTLGRQLMQSPRFCKPGGSPYGFTTPSASGLFILERLSSWPCVILCTGHDADSCAFCMHVALHHVH